MNTVIDRKASVKDMAQMTSREADTKVASSQKEETKDKMELALDDIEEDSVSDEEEEEDISHRDCEICHYGMYGCNDKERCCKNCEGYTGLCEACNGLCRYCESRRGETESVRHFLKRNRDSTFQGLRADLTKINSELSLRNKQLKDIVREQARRISTLEKIVSKLVSS